MIELLTAIWEFVTNPLILLMLGIGCVRKLVSKI